MTTKPRICNGHNCTTVLSRYNPNPHCSPCWIKKVDIEDRRLAKEPLPEPAAPPAPKPEWTKPRPSVPRLPTLSSSPDPDLDCFLEMVVRLGIKSPSDYLAAIDA